jgi:hypothetical protein
MDCFICGRDYDLQWLANKYKYVTVCEDGDCEEKFLNNQY